MSCKICSGKLTVDEVFKMADKETDMALCRYHLEIVHDMLTDELEGVRE